MYSTLIKSAMLKNRTRSQRAEIRSAKLAGNTQYTLNYSLKWLLLTVVKYCKKQTNWMIKIDPGFRSNLITLNLPILFAMQ